MTGSALKILLAGTPGRTVIVGEALRAAGHEIVGALAPFPKPVGRKKIITASELEQWARSKHIPVFNVNKEVLNGLELPAQLPQADLLVVADFGYLIPGWLLKFPKFGGLNIHPSLLPRWRGTSPVPFTLLFGDTSTGVTIIKMNEQFDKGEIVAQHEIEIAQNDTAPTLLEKGFTAGAELLVEILPDYIEGNIALKPQVTTSPTPLTRKFTKDDGFVPLEALKATMEGKSSDKSAPILAEYYLETNAVGIYRMIRALTPWPGVWTILKDGKRMKILGAKLDTNALVIQKIQIEGKNPTTSTKMSM
jgi:methionyl-tRNA formyltransferase